MKCAVCGRTEDCVIEPRFGFAVCKDHADIPPTEIREAAAAYVYFNG